MLPEISKDPANAPIGATVQGGLVVRDYALHGFPSNRCRRHWPKCGCRHQEGVQIGGDMMGPKCKHCGRRIAPQNEATAKIFRNVDVSRLKLLCAECHAGQRELYKDNRRDWYDRRPVRASGEVK